MCQIKFNFLPTCTRSSHTQRGDEEVVWENTQTRGQVPRTGGTGSTVRRTLTAALGEWGQIRPQSNCRRNAHIVSV